MRISRVVAGTATVVALVSGCASSIGGSASTGSSVTSGPYTCRPAVDASACGQVGKIAADDVKRRGGGGAATLVQFVASTREKANKAAGGDIVPGDQKVYLIQITGNFIGGPDSYPCCTAPSPKPFTELTAIVDASTFMGLDNGMSSQPADLSSLGTVITVQ
jgi:hypothetical protein